LAPVFPLLPWFWPLLLLQIVNGGALQFAWSGSRTLSRMPSKATPFGAIYSRGVLLSDTAKPSM
jgi:hypothetical protein